MSKKNEWSKTVQYLSIVFAITIIFVTVFVSIWTTKLHFNVDVKCRFENIEYVDLAENMSCWNNREDLYDDDISFLDEYCPMPQTVDCDFNLIMPLNVKSVVEFIKEID